MLRWVQMFSHHLMCLSPSAEHIQLLIQSQKHLLKALKYVKAKRFGFTLQHAIKLHGYLVEIVYMSDLVSDISGSLCCGTELSGL